jgi:hypothetical protein
VTVLLPLHQAPRRSGVCLNALRNYWNRPLVQAIVATHARERRDESPYPGASGLAYRNSSSPRKCECTNAATFRGAM